MVGKIWRAWKASRFWLRAKTEASNGNPELALNYLDSYCRYMRPTYSALLLRGFLLYEIGDYEQSISALHAAMGAVEDAPRLNSDEKSYLVTFARSVVNSNRQKQGKLDDVIKLDMTFDETNIHNRHKMNFPLFPQDLAGK